MKTLITLTLALAFSSYKGDHALSTVPFSEEGIASYYSDYYQGRITANGEIFDQTKLTAAHKSLPFGTKVKVLNLANKQSVEVTINDRGPYIEGRIIDLSYTAAEQVSMIQAGIEKVRIEIIPD